MLIFPNPVIHWPYSVQSSKSISVHIPYQWGSYPTLCVRQYTLQEIAVASLIPRLALPSCLIPRLALPSCLIPRLALPSYLISRLALPSYLIPRLALPFCLIPRLALPPCLIPRLALLKCLAFCWVWPWFLLRLLRWPLFTRSLPGLSILVRVHPPLVLTCIVRAHGHLHKDMHNVRGVLFVCVTPQ